MTCLLVSLLTVFRTHCSPCPSSSSSNLFSIRRDRKCRSMIRHRSSRVCNRRFLFLFLCISAAFILEISADKCRCVDINEHRRHVASCKYSMDVNWLRHSSSVVVYCVKILSTTSLLSLDSLLLTACGNMSWMLLKEKCRIASYVSTMNQFADQSPWLMDAYRISTLHTR